MSIASKWLLLAFCVGVASACGGPATPTTSTNSGAADPVAMNGGGTSFRAMTRGRVTVVDLWASWCPSCKEELPRVQEFARVAKRDGILVVTVNVGESREKAAEFAAAVGLELPVFLDEEFAYSDSVGASQLPAVLVLRGDGTIAHRAKRLDRGVVEALSGLTGAGGASRAQK